MVWNQDGTNITLRIELSWERRGLPTPLVIGALMEARPEQIIVPAVGKVSGYSSVLGVGVALQPPRIDQTPPPDRWGSFNKWSDRILKVSALGKLAWDILGGIFRRPIRAT